MNFQFLPLSGATITNHQISSLIRRCAAVKTNLLIHVTKGKTPFDFGESMTFTKVSPSGKNLGSLM